MLFVARLRIARVVYLTFSIAGFRFQDYDVVVGGGVVYLELNFTLPPMLVSEETMPEIRQHYRQIITRALQRAVELEAAYSGGIRTPIPI